MTEAQRAQQAEAPEHEETDEAAELDLGVHSDEVGDRAWTVRDLPGGKSWDVFRGAEREGPLGERIARIAVSDTGYFSTDGRGTVRGPYVTLDEAVYPIGLDDPTLLGMDVVRQQQDSSPSPSSTSTAPPVPTAPPVSTRPAVSTAGVTGRMRPALLIALALVGLAVGVALARRPRPARTPRTCTRSGG